MDLLLAITPLPVILFCMAVLGKPADVSGGAAWLATLGVSCLYFGTDFQVALLTSLSGCVASLPVTAILVFSMLQVALMEETGAIRRISALFKCFFTEDKAVQVLFLSCALSTVLSTIGAVPIVLMPSVLLALGFSVPLAIALPVMGYAGSCTVSLLGVPSDLLSRFSGLSMYETFAYLGRYMFAANLAVALCCLWVAGGVKLARQGLIPAILTGLACWLGTWLANLTGLYAVTGILMGILMLGFYMLYLRLRRRKIYDRDCLDEQDLRAEKRLSLLRAISPWLGLSLVLVLVNAPQLPFHNFLNTPMAVEIIPGEREKIRLFGQAYFWVLILTLACTPLMRPSGGHVRNALRKWGRRALRPAAAAVFFFAMAYLFNHSGLDADWRLISPENNMMMIAANSAAGFLGGLYGAFAPFISLLAGMLTGSQAAVIALFTGLHMKAASLSGFSEGLVAAGGAMGAGIASMVSPMKILSAASVLDCPEKGSKVLRSLLGLSLLATLAVSLNCLLLEWLL